MNNARNPERRGPWTVLSSRPIYRNRWMRVREDEVIHPDGSPGIFGVVEGLPSVSIVAITDDERVYLVGQHRYAINTYTWDLPGGALDGQEDPLAGAKRELREETGLQAERWTPIGYYYPHRDTLEVTVYLFLAQHLTTGTSAPEGSERLQVQSVPLTAALRRVQRGEMSSGPAVVGLIRAWHMLRNGQLLLP